MKEIEEFIFKLKEKADEEFKKILQEAEISPDPSALHNVCDQYEAFYEREVFQKLTEDSLKSTIIERLRYLNKDNYNYYMRIYNWCDYY